MTSRKVLLVTYHFPPSAASGSFRLLGFARHLPKYGWRPLVVAPPELPWEPTDARLGARIPRETRVFAAPYPRHWPKVIRWSAPYAVWLPAARAACWEAVKTENPDAVLTSGPPHGVHLLGLDLRKNFGLPWIADFRDPWIQGTDKPPRQSPARWWQQFWESKVLRGADRILANAPYACQQLQKAFPDQAARIVTLTNGFDPVDQEGPTHHRGHPLRLVHAGQIYSGRDPRPFLDALVQWRKTFQVPELRVEFLGRTAGHGVDLTVEIANRDLEGMVQVRDQVSYGQSLEIMRGADLLVLLDSPGRRVGVPAKVYEYLGAGRPILALAEPDGDTACILRESGLVYDQAQAGDAQAILLSLERLVKQVESGEPSAPDPEKIVRFTRENLAGQLAGLLQVLVEPDPKGARVGPLATCPLHQGVS